MKGAGSFLLGAIGVAAMMLVAVPAWALETDGGVHLGGGGGVDTSIGVGVGGGSSPGAPGASTLTGSTPSIPWILYPTVRRYGTEEDANRGWCRLDVWRRLPAGADPGEATAARVFEYEQLFRTGGVLHGLNANNVCEGNDPVAAITAQMAEDVVYSFVRSDWLPRPQLSVPPGYGLVGMPAYLVTDHWLEHLLSRQPVDLGILQVEIAWQAMGVSTVDWGDGTVEQFDVAGRPWPHGEVTHTYQDAGNYRISLQDTWTIMYQLGSLTGSVTAVLDPVVLDGLEVEERRTVRLAGRG